MAIVGRVIMWAGELSKGNLRMLKKAGFIPCDGSLVMQVDFPELFNVIHDNYKYTPAENFPPGHFRLPDLRGRSPIGAGKSGHLTERQLGSYFGSEAHNLTLDEIPAHTHSTIHMIADNNTDGVDSVTRHSGDHHNEPEIQGLQVEDSLITICSHQWRYIF